MANNFESGNNLVSATLRTKLNSFDISIPNPVRRLPLFINHAQSTALKKKLQDQLNENTTQIQLTADLNTALAKRRLELERQIKELDKIEFNEIPQGLGNNLIDVEKPTAFSTTSSGRGSRRDRNTAKGHQIGMEFATEIGQGLLQEVRRLQTLLHEKEAITKGLEVEKAELERTVEQLNKNLRAHQESKDELNEQIWALELAKLDLNAQLEDSQQQLSKSHSNYAKIEKALSTATDVIEQFKEKEEKLTSNIENLKILFEKDTNTENNHETTDDLKSQFESLLKVSGSNNKILNGDDENPNVRIKTNNALDVANRVIGVLYDILKKEKDKLKMLADSQEQDLFEFMHNEECSDTTSKQVQKIQDGSSTTFEPSNATKNDIPFNKIENDRNDEWEIV